MGDYELYHASTRKHKYIKKIGNRYFYTQQEIQAYYDGKKTIDSEYQKELAANSQQNKTSPQYPAPKYAVMDGAYSVSTITKQVAREANVKQARKMVNDTKNAAVKTKMVITDPDFRKDKIVKDNVEKDKIVKDEIVKDEVVKEKRKKKASKSTSKHLSKSLKSLKKQAIKGKKAIDKWYTKATTPDITVTYDEAKIKKK